MLPVRVLHQPYSQFFGYGANASEVDALTSIHRRGHEPYGQIRLFGHTWERDRGAFTWSNEVYLTWRMVV